MSKMKEKVKKTNKTAKVLLSAMMTVGLVAGVGGGVTPLNAAVDTEYDLIDMVKSPMVKDANFEAGGTEWKVRNKGVIASDVSYGTGTKSGSVPSGNSSSFIGQNIALEANTDYIVTAYIKVDIADAHLFFGAREGGEGSGKNIKDIRVSPGNTDWNKVTLDFNTGANTNTLIQFVKWAENGESNYNSVRDCNGYIDNVKIQKKGDVSQEEDYEMIWADDFNTSELNENNWGYELGSIRGVEQQHYVKNKDNTFMKDGKLVLKATDRPIEDQYKNPRGNRQVIYNSGSVRTHGKQEFLYGRIEMKAKLPKGKGVFPAFWTLGSNFTLDGDIANNQGNPWSRCGEIDIMELTGKELGNVGNKQAWGTPHFYLPKDLGGDGDLDGKGSGGKVYEISEDFNNDYHVFGVNWSPDKIEWYVDGIIYNTLDFSNKTWGKYAKMSYSQPQYIQFNLAMGGNWPGDAGTNLAGTEFDVDYVYYAQNEEQKAAAKAYYDAAPNISGLKNITMNVGETPDLLADITSDKDSYVDFSIDNEYMFKNEGGLTNADRVCSGKSDTAKLATLPAGKYNIHYTAIPNNVEFESNSVPNREKEYKMTRRTVTLTVNEITFPTGFELNGVYGEKLSTVALPENWSWVSPETVITDKDAKHSVKYSKNGVEKIAEVNISLVSADKNTLNELVKKAEDLVKSNLYNDSTVSVLKDKITEAKLIQNKENATKDDITAVINGLNNAISKLVEKPSTPPSVDDKYEINEGEEISFKQGEEAIFRSNAPIDKFKEVLLDGKVLDKSNYTVKEGSTVITLNPEFTKTLGGGNHVLTIVSTDGKAETTFAVTPVAITPEKPVTPDTPTNPIKPSNPILPVTNDETQMLLWVGLIGIASSIALLLKRVKE